MQIPGDMPAKLQSVDDGPAGICANPPLQQAAVALKRQKVDKNLKLEDLPVVDDTRVLPENFDKACLEAYKRLPEACLPQKKGTGKLNYTIRANMASFEVQLWNKAFILKMDVNGLPHQKENGSAQSSWLQFGGVQEAWEDKRAKSKARIVSGRSPNRWLKANVKLFEHLHLI